MQKSHFYKRDILRALFINGPQSAADLVIKIGRSFTLVVKMLSELTQENIVVEKGLAPSSGGRRPVLYELKADTFYIMAIAMDQFVTKISLLNAANSPVCPTIYFELNLNTHPDPLQFLTDRILAVIDKKYIPSNRIIGIGIGMPGFINPAKGINYTFLGANICAVIQKATNIPVYIENDSSIIALAEQTIGKAANVGNSMVVNLSWGIGLGMIIQGQLFRGQSGFAGEFSHIALFANGKLCSCGKTGCLETESSLTYMIDQAASKMAAGHACSISRSIIESEDHQLKSQAFLKAAAKGDSLIMEIISESGYNIGRGIAIIIHLLNPAKIILSGRCAEIGQLWLPPIWQALNTFCIPTLIQSTKIEVSEMHKDAGLFGAAILVMDQTSAEELAPILSQGLPSFKHNKPK